MNWNVAIGTAVVLLAMIAYPFIRRALSSTFPMIVTRLFDALYVVAVNYRTIIALR